MTVLTWVGSSRFLFRPMILVLAVLVLGLVLFSINYLSYGAVPGNNAEYPLGWWGWFDQSKYLAASQNFQSGALLPEEHVYPPLYPLLGAVFLSISEMHGYLIPTVLLFVCYLILFLLVFKNHIGWWGAAVAIGVGLFQYQVLVLQWVIPWTSSLAAVLQMVALLFFHRFLDRRDDPDWPVGDRVLNATLCALAVGLLAPTRPLDFIVFMPLLIVYVAFVIIPMINGTNCARGGGYLVIGCGVMAASLPVVLYLGFNNYLFDEPFGGYFAVAQNAGGATFGDIFDRSYSHIFDSEVFYAEPDADWASQLPFLAFSLCFVPVALFFGPIFFRVLAFIALLHLALVYSYADAVPTGQFRYFNIHYFKWLYPVLPVFFLVLLKDVWAMSGQTRKLAFGKLSAGLALVLAVALMEPRYIVHDPSSVRVLGPGKIEITFDEVVDLDFIDVAGLTATIGHTDFWAQTVEINGGQPLRPISQVRVTPRPNGVRFLLTDTAPVRLINLVFSDLGELDPNNVSVIAAQVAVLSWPFSRADTALPRFPPPVLVPGEMQVVSDAQASGIYFVSGWSGAEAWGRWMDGPAGVISFSLPPGTPDTARLVIEGNGFLVEPQSAVVIEIVINGISAGIMHLNPEGPSRVELPLFGNQELPTSEVTVELIPARTLSPLQAGLSGDQRQLSLGLTRFGVLP